MMNMNMFGSDMYEDTKESNLLGIEMSPEHRLYVENNREQIFREEEGRVESQQT